MKEGDREFEKLLKEAVCSYHKEKMDALPSEEELQDIQLSDDFYRKIDGLLKKQKHRLMNKRQRKWNKSLKRLSLISMISLSIWDRLRIWAASVQFLTCYQEWG